MKKPNQSFQDSILTANKLKRILFSILLLPLASFTLLKDSITCTFQEIFKLYSVYIIKYIDRLYTSLMIQKMKIMKSQKHLLSDLELSNLYQYTKIKYQKPEKSRLSYPSSIFQQLLTIVDQILKDFFNTFQRSQDLSFIGFYTINERIQASILVTTQLLCLRYLFISFLYKTDIKILYANKNLFLSPIDLKNQNLKHQNHKENSKLIQEMAIQSLWVDFSDYAHRLASFLILNDFQSKTLEFHGEDSQSLIETYNTSYFLSDECLPSAIIQNQCENKKYHERNLEMKNRHQTQYLKNRIKENSNKEINDEKSLSVFHQDPSIFFSDQTLLSSSMNLFHTFKAVMSAFKRSRNESLVSNDCNDSMKYTQKMLGYNRYIFNQYLLIYFQIDLHHSQKSICIHDKKNTWNFFQTDLFCPQVFQIHPNDFYLNPQEKEWIWEARKRFYRNKDVGRKNQNEIFQPIYKFPEDMNGYESIINLKEKEIKSQAPNLLPARSQSMELKKIWMFWRKNGQKIFYNLFYIRSNSLLVKNKHFPHDFMDNLDHNLYTFVLLYRNDYDLQRYIRKCLFERLSYSYFMPWFLPDRSKDQDKALLVSPTSFQIYSWDSLQRQQISLDFLNILMYDRYLKIFLNLDKNRNLSIYAPDLYYIPSFYYKELFPIMIQKKPKESDKKNSFLSVFYGLHTIDKIQSFFIVKYKPLLRTINITAIGNYLRNAKNSILVELPQRNSNQSNKKLLKQKLDQVSKKIRHRPPSLKFIFLSDSFIKGKQFAFVYHKRQKDFKLMGLDTNDTKFSIEGRKYKDIFQSEKETQSIRNAADLSLEIKRDIKKDLQINTLTRNIQYLYKNEEKESIRERFHGLDFDLDMRFHEDDTYKTDLRSHKKMIEEKWLDLRRSYKEMTDYSLLTTKSLLHKGLRSALIFLESRKCFKEPAVFRKDDLLVAFQLKYLQRVLFLLRTINTKYLFIYIYILKNHYSKYLMHYYLQEISKNNKPTKKTSCLLHIYSRQYIFEESASNYNQHGAMNHCRLFFKSRHKLFQDELLPCLTDSMVAYRRYRDVHFFTNYFKPSMNDNLYIHYVKLTLIQDFQFKFDSPYHQPYILPQQQAITGEKVLNIREYLINLYQSLFMRYLQIINQQFFSIKGSMTRQKSSSYPFDYKQFHYIQSEILFTYEFFILYFSSALGNLF